MAADTMSLLARLESRFGRWAVPNITAIIIMGQVLVYFMNLMQGDDADFSATWLLPGRVLDGEVWRLATFIFSPPADRPLFVIFHWILLSIFGNSLEQIWGAFRYNMFLLIAYFAHIFACFAIWAYGGDIAILLAQMTMLGLSRGLVNYSEALTAMLFLAFSRLHPHFILNLFFILPIKIYWLAIIYAGAHGYVFLRGNWAVKLLVLTAMLNYILFFGRDHIRTWKHGQRRRSFESKARVAAKAIQHQCRVCDLNSENSPRMLFRYCSKCTGQSCYCPEHIREHEHVTSDEE